MSRKMKTAYVLAALLLSLVIASTDRTYVRASSTGDYLNTLNQGVATIIDPKSGDDTSKKKAEAVEKLDSLTKDQNGTDQTDTESSADDLVMANVQSAMNIRTAPSDDAQKAGVLYKDCGGHVLEQQGEWTKIESGDLVGWAKNKYLLFGEQAEKSADEVGSRIIVVESDALRVRKQASTTAEPEAVLARGDSLEVVDDSAELPEGWIAVDYEGENGYVQEQYVTQDFKVDTGETEAKIEAREKEEKEKEEKKKAAALAKSKAASGTPATSSGTAVAANADETRLLGALIQCEAGCESYDGQLAVGAVVMNRVKSGAYPNSISSVIYASGQFTPAMNGKVARYYNGNVNSSCIQAAQAAIAGQSNVGGATHFRRAGNHDGLLIGNQVFW